MVTLFTIVLLLCISMSNAQDTTDNKVRFWNFKIKVQTMLDYVPSVNTSIKSTDISICAKTVISNQTDLELNKDYIVYVDVSFIEDTDNNVSFNDTSQMTVNFTFWTDNKSLFNKMKEFLVSDPFHEAFINQMEDNHGVDVMSISSEIIHTHGETVKPLWETWLDLANYTPFQWACVVVAILVLCIGCFCFIYCCVCKSGDHNDPYRNVQLQRTYGGQSNSSVVKNGSPQSQDQAINWVHV